MLPCDAAVMIKEDPCMQPHHRVSMQLEIMEASIQYMGSNILMGRMCNLDVLLQDEWRSQHGHEHEEVCGGDQSPRTSTQRSFLCSHIISGSHRNVLIPVVVCTFVTLPYHKTSH